MTITKIKLENFTVFRSLEMDSAPGINVLVGKNGTGKTHLMKVAYAACAVSKSEKDFAEKLVGVFLPSGHALGRLVKRYKGGKRSAVEVHRGHLKLRASFSNRATAAKSATITGAKDWAAHPVEAVYIPVKEMLANAPGFRSLYAQREIHFEEVYADIIDKAYVPPRRGPTEKPRKQLLAKLQGLMQGKVAIKNEEFFLRNKQGNLEFTLLAEGTRKLGLLWLLIQNGTLLQGSVLFWDEPEANLNPSVLGQLMDILLDLQRMGVQVFLATHDYVVLKELDLRRRPEDKVMFHALYRGEDGEICIHSTESYLALHPNAIAETFASLYDREIKRGLEGKAA